MAKRYRWVGDFDIPAEVRLPGLRVKVSIKPCNSQGFFAYDPTKDLAEIVISDALPVEVQRYVLLHELIHVANDLCDQMLERFPDDVKTLRAAGIDQVEHPSRDEAPDAG